MSKAFHPPKTLSKEDIRTIADVRRDIWTNGFIGLGTGSATGIGIHLVGSAGNKLGIWKLPLTRNTAALFFMMGGAIGSFVMATTAGKNEVHNLHDIYNRGSRNQMSSYEEALQQAKQREQEILLSRRRQTASTKDAAVPVNIDNDDPSLERIQREKNRLYRKVTLKQSLDNGHGISDAHGGHWAHDEDVTKFRKG